MLCQLSCTIVDFCLHPQVQALAAVVAFEMERRSVGLLCISTNHAIRGYQGPLNSTPSVTALSDLCTILDTYLDFLMDFPANLDTSTVAVKFIYLIVVNDQLEYHL